MNLAVAHEKEEIIALLKSILKAKLYVSGKLAQPIFEDSVETGILDPVAALAVAFEDGKPIAWTVRTTDDWRTGVDDSGPRSEDEMFWRFTHPDFREQGIYRKLRKQL